MTALQAKTSAEVEALLAQNSHSSKQVEVLQAELHRIKGGTTLSFAALQNEELQEVRRQLVTQSRADCWGTGPQAVRLLPRQPHFWGPNVLLCR
jgi:hypothetical protein